MADLHKYFEKLLQFEGTRLENVQGDSGSWTKDGITIFDYKKYGKDLNADGKLDEKDLALMTNDQAFQIIKAEYWDKMLCDQIVNQSMAEEVFDFGYNAGIGTAVKKLQDCLNIASDGVIGPNTLKCLNEANNEQIFDCLKAKRLAYYQAIVDNKPLQKKFLKGWQARANSFKYK